MISHQGFDRDNNTWETESFSKCETRLKESIAQYFTKSHFNNSTLKSNRIPRQILYEKSLDYKSSFNTLLKQQSEDYYSFINEYGDFPLENVSSALINLRKTGRLEYGTFLRILGRY